jgi:hypothetical protein
VALVPSTRLRNHVVFHCPACFDDRIGRKRHGVWMSWPSDDERVGSYVECTACRAQTSNCNVSASPVGTSFANRLNTGVRAAAALIVRSAPSDDRLLAAALEFANCHTTTDFSARQLLDLTRDPRLVVNVCGSLRLLNEDLTDQARRSLIGAIVELAQTADRALALDAADFCVLFLIEEVPARPSRRRRG